MFKKTLIAMAALGAMAGVASAADVEIYGIIDTGLAYTHDKVDGTANVSQDWHDFSGMAGHTKGDEFRMDSGINSASRFGIRGTEDLGNGLTVGFKLENGFSSDSGTLGEDRLFGREATLNVTGGFGSVYMGRMGALVSDTGSVGFYGSMASAFGSGWSDNIAGHTAVMANYTSRMDNTIAYVSPEFSGVKVYAQYAMGAQGEENTADSDRYAALGAEWKAGNLDMGVLVDWLNKYSGSEGVWKKHDPNVSDQWTFNVAGAYDFGVAKTFLAVQYFKDAYDAGNILTDIGFFDSDFYTRDTQEKKDRAANFSKAAFRNTGYGVHLSTAFDALGGSFKAGIGYMDADIDYAHDGEIGDSKAYTVAVGYEYPLSKRTTLYTGAGYMKREADFAQRNSETKKTDTGSWEAQSYDVVAGFVHKF